MNQKEYQALIEGPLSGRGPDVLLGSMLTNQTPRTLLWGYDLERNSWHVYLDEFGIINRVHYSYPNKLISFWQERHIPDNRAYTPTKRLYPEACDYEFSKMLLESNTYMPWTTFNNERKPGLWHGKTLTDMDT
jgi:hypothetical protein